MSVPKKSLKGIPLPTQAHPLTTPTNPRTDNLLLVKGIKKVQAGMKLWLDVTWQMGVAIVRCHGRIVFGQEVDELRLAVLSLLKETNRVVLHLAGIEHIDSEGLAGLVGVFISARNCGGEVKLADLTPKSKQVLRITCLDKIFQTYDSEAEAVASFQGSNTAVA
jgi:anti-sigma B factor antagonist